MLRKTRRLGTRALRWLMGWVHPVPRLTFHDIETRRLEHPMTLNRKGEPVAVPRWK